MNLMHNSSHILLLLSAWLLVALSGCVSTVGSGFVGKSHLAKGNYIDLNTVPEQDEAQRPSGLHAGDEQTAHLRDHQELEKKRLEVRTKGEDLRQKAFTATKTTNNEVTSSRTLPQKKDSSNGKKSRS